MAVLLLAAALVLALFAGSCFTVAYLGCGSDNGPAALRPEQSGRAVNQQGG